MSKVVTRFAPSPTGFLHIGGARTALFNWLFAKHHGGHMLLRIEDTDRERSTDAAVAAIIEGMKWLELDYEGEPISQFARADRHREIVRRLLDEGHAYYCQCTPEELAEMREKAKAEGRPMTYDRRCRDLGLCPPHDRPLVVRFKAPREGEIVIDDAVQGRVEFKAEAMDDLVGWEPPKMAHIPLIHGPDGAKLSKRHGALGVEAYRAMGYLPEAMRNYLARLGWSHGDDEIFSTEQLVEWFDLDAVGKSAARFDFAKLESVNGWWIRNLDDARLLSRFMEFLPHAEEDQRELAEAALEALRGEAGRSRFLQSLPGLKERAKTLKELLDLSAYLFVSRPLEMQPKAEKILAKGGREVLADLLPILESVPEWTEEALEKTVKAFAEEKGLKLGKVAQPLRAALTGSSVSPGIFDAAEGGVRSRHRRRRTWRSAADVSGGGRRGSNRYHRRRCR